MNRQYSTNRQRSGKIGEKIAERYIVRKGYEILDRRCKNKCGEIDIIASKGKEIIFIEVKLRHSSQSQVDQYFSAEDNLSDKKIQKVKKASEYYLRENDLLTSKYNQWRVDAITINIEGNKARIKHYKNI